MKKKNLFRRMALLAVTLATMFVCAIGVSSDDDVKPHSISRIGKSTITVTTGQDLELKVKTNPLDADDDYLRWKIISGKTIVKIDDDDRTDDELELKALKKGTAKVRCYIKGKSSKQVTYTIKVKAASNKISAAVTTKTVEVGDDFELEIKKYSGLKNKNLKWTIKNPKLVKFDGGKTGKEVEFKAKKTGTATIVCKNTKTDQEITFTVKIVRDSSNSNYGDSSYGNTNYGNTNYGNTNYGNTNYGDSGYDD